MKVTELDRYLFGCIPEPDAITEPVSHHYWVGNNNKLIGFLEMYVNNGELASLLSDNMKTVWTNLLTCHEKQGPITQVRLIQEVLSVSYLKDVTTWQATTNRMQDLCDCNAQAVPTKNVMLMLAMLTGLEHKADNIRSKMTSYYVSNKAANSTALSECIEQEIMYKNKHENSSDTALAVYTSSCHNRPSNCSNKICSNPICPQPNSHLGSNCWEKGGVVEGKRDEVLTRRAKADEDCERQKGSSNNNSGRPSASGICCDETGHTYIVDSVSGQAILLAAADDRTTPTLALAAFEPSTDPIYASMSNADRFEYHALFLDDHSTSINWHERRRMVSAGNILVATSGYPNFLTTSSNNMVWELLLVVMILDWEVQTIFVGPKVI